MKEHFLFVLGAVACVAACGGSVVFEEDGAGGSGGTASSSKSGSVSGSKSASGSKASTNVSATQTGTTDVVATSGGCQLPDPSAPTTCPDACSDLFDCGVLLCDDEFPCPGFFQIDKQSFMMGCVPQCSQQMALISIVDPSSCDTTVETFKSLSFDFAQQCQGFDDG